MVVWDGMEYVSKKCSVIVIDCRHEVGTYSSPIIGNRRAQLPTYIPSILAYRPTINGQYS